MPPLVPGYIPSSLPDVDDTVNFLTIAFKNGKYTPINEFDPPQKIRTFDMLLVRGFQAMAPPVKALRKKAHRSYIKNKDDREINQRYSNVMCLGSLVSKELNEDEIMILLNQNPTLLNFKLANQKTEDILCSFLYYMSPRINTVQAPVFHDALEQFAFQVAYYVPSFLNSRRIRVGWSEDIAPYFGEYYGLQKNTFKVHHEFSEDEAGKCTGTFVEEQPARGRTLSAVLASQRPPASQTRGSVAEGKRKQVKPQDVDPDDEVYEAIYNDIDYDAILAAVNDASQKASNAVLASPSGSQGLNYNAVLAAITDASQKAANDILASQIHSQTRNSATPRKKNPRAATPSASTLLTIREEDYDEEEPEGGWHFDPPSAGIYSQSPPPGPARQKIVTSAMQPRTPARDVKMNRGFTF